ncbi:hypothetical protein [Acetobacter sp.]|uniref:hypothetical protein n=1 Tax=Acetobacter sp. TaxID=440 RepID=UPI0039E8AC39
MSDGQLVICADETRYPSTEYRLVGSVKTVRGKDINKPARIGQFPVFIDKKTTSMFTYSRKIKKITDA